MDDPLPVPWAEGELIGYDTETGGVLVEEDPIVSAVVVHVVPGRAPVVHKWLIYPETEIPQGAIDVHGITTEYAREHGRPAAEVLTEIHGLLHTLWRPGVPLVGHNPTFDLTITDRQFARHLGLDLPLLGPVVDTLTIDRRWWKYVKGKGMRKLVPTCARYGLGELENAHDAEVDATAALRLAWAESKKFPQQVGLVDPAVLHERQSDWYRMWARDFAGWLDRQVVTLERGLRFRLPGVVAKVLTATLGEDAESTEENIAEAFRSLRERRDSVAASADDWPMRPRPAAEEVA